MASQRAASFQMKERKEEIPSCEETQNWRSLWWSDKEGMYINEEYLYLVNVKYNLSPADVVVVECLTCELRDP